MGQLSEIEAVIELIQDNPMPEDIQGMRAAIDAGGGPAADDIKVETVDANGVHCELHTPPGADETRCIQYLHGGGYVLGSLESHRPMVSEIARAANCRALAVHYRLAPEHAYPAAVDDSVAVYEWLLGQGYPAEQLAIAGDSAGGGLTIATMVALRDKGAALPRTAACICPWVDLEATSETYATRAEIDPFINQDMISMLAGAYMAGGDAKTPLASPIHADLSGLPPLLIQVGSREVLFGDADGLRQRALDAGVDVSFEEWEGMIHVWHQFAPMLSDGRKAIARVGEYVQQQLAG